MSVDGRVMGDDDACADDDNGGARRCRAPTLLEKRPDRKFYEYLMCYSIKFDT